MNIRKYIPKEEATKFYRVLVKGELLDRVNDIRKKMGLTWNELQEAMFLALLDDAKRNKK